jgi:hypothetical protein
LRRDFKHRIEDSLERPQLSLGEANVVASDFDVVVVFERALDRVVE